MMTKTSDEWSVLVERNVPGVKQPVIRQIVEALMVEQAYAEPNFWHVANSVRHMLDTCNCTPCVTRRWRPEYI